MRLMIMAVLLISAGGLANAQNQTPSSEQQNADTERSRNLPGRTETERATPGVVDRTQAAPADTAAADERAANVDEVGEPETMRASAWFVFGGIGLALIAFFVYLRNRSITAPPGPRL